MDREDKDSIQYDYIDKLLQKIYGYTDEQILKDFEEAEKDDGSYPDFPEYPDEFDRIWEDIQAERAERMKSEPEEEAATVVEPPRKVRKIRWKRVAITGIAACLVTLSVCFVAVGKKSYFYRERIGAGDNIIFNNDSSIISVEDQEVAYASIQEAFGKKPLKLGYIAPGLTFDEVGITDRKATMKFSDGNRILYFVQVTDETEASNSHRSDAKIYSTVSNKWLVKEITIRTERIHDVDYYEAQFSYNDVVCWVYGNMEYDEFSKIVERVVY